VERGALYGYQRLGRQQKEILSQGLPVEESSQDVRMLNWALNTDLPAFLP
jgi:hypothetical protein